MSHDPKTKREFIPICIAIMTISDSRTDETDASGNALVERLTDAGHSLAQKSIVKDNVYDIRAKLSGWIADPKINAVITTGGTGLTGRDVTPEAVMPLFDQSIEGFGELFRQISYKKIKTSTMQSRAIGGTANGTFIFCLPGSPGACRDGWDDILVHQFDYRSRPCNLIEIMPRLSEV